MTFGVIFLDHKTSITRTQRDKETLNKLKYDLYAWLRSLFGPNMVLQQITFDVKFIIILSWNIFFGYIQGTDIPSPGLPRILVHLT